MRIKLQVIKASMGGTNIKEAKKIANTERELLNLIIDEHRRPMLKNNLHDERLEAREKEGTSFSKPLIEGVTDMEVEVEEQSGQNVQNRNYVSGMNTGDFVHLSDPPSSSLLAKEGQTDCYESLVEDSMKEGETLGTSQDVMMLN